MSPFRVENFGLVWYNEKKDQRAISLDKSEFSGLIKYLKYLFDNYFEFPSY